MNPILTWALLTSVQSAPLVLGSMMAPSPLGGAFPAARLPLVVLWGLFFRYLGRLDAPSLYLLALALATAPLDRSVHQPVMFAVQVLAAYHLWRIAGTRAERTIATVQTIAAFVVFPIAQLSYGVHVRPGGSGSALYEIAGPLAGLSIPTLGTLAVHLAIRRDRRASS